MHVVVIGGGIIGLTTAYHLVKEGASVTLVDARETGLGATDTNAGWLVPADSAPLTGPTVIWPVLKWMLQPDSPVYIKPTVKPDELAFLLRMLSTCTSKAQRAGFAANLEFTKNTLKFFDEYRADGMDFQLETQGLLLAYKDKANFEGLALLLYRELLERYGLAPTMFVGDAVREFEPRLADSVYGGWYFPKERAVDPRALAGALHKRLVELGAEIVEKAPIDRVDIVDGRVRSIASGRQIFTADNYVLAAGAWSGQVSQKFGLDLPIRAGKGYSVDLEPIELRCPINLGDANVAITSFNDRLRACGTMEIAGLDEEINQVRVDAVLRAPGEYFRDFESPRVMPTALAGMRPMSADNLPIIGRLGTLRNAFVGTGHAMFGMTQAPATAEALTRLIMHDEFSPALRPYASTRFLGGR